MLKLPMSTHYTIMTLWGLYRKRPVYYISSQQRTHAPVTSREWAPLHTRLWKPHGKEKNSSSLSEQNPGRITGPSELVSRWYNNP
jgi:hypothetical protein